ncbi:MAG: cytochrome c biogenesis protein ResB [Deltaproteobacteria bacterium]|nr:cytochrome c biogenesis protein ResB [Deltaproteobacteria bacterium]
MTERLLRTLASLRVTLPLLFGLALGALLGTVMPQNLGEADYLRLFGPTLAPLLGMLGLFDVYRSPWFITLLGLLALNLCLCTWRLVPALRRTLREFPPAPTAARTGRHFSEPFSVTGLSPEEAARAVETFLANRFSPLRRRQEGETIHLFAQRGAWTRLAVITIHGSVLLILAGGAAGLLWGFQGYAVIREGETAHELLPTRGGKPLPLGFGLRCDDFSVAFHEGHRLPREFKSRVSILEGGQTVVERQPITVNAPLGYRGIRFYQSNYGPAAPPQVTLQIRHPSLPHPWEQTLAPGENRPLPGGGTLRLLRFSPTFREFGPTALAELLLPGNQELTLPVFKNHPELSDHHGGGGFRLKLVGFRQPYYTVLLAGYDPGVGLVWAGFLLLGGGLATALLWPRRRIWISIVAGRDRLDIAVTGEGRHPLRPEEAFLATLSHELRRRLAKGS